MATATTSRKIRFEIWREQVSEKFQNSVEFAMAKEIYSFRSAYDDGFTPSQAYVDFKEWIMS